MIKKYNDFVNENSDSQLEMGIKIESEHNNIYEELEKWMEDTYKDYASMPWTREEFYAKIAKAHLIEIDDYYTRLIKMEKE